MLWPDESEQLSRLVIWRQDIAFDAEEIDAMMTAATEPIPWTGEKNGWTVSLVPLPDKTSLPAPMLGPSRVWESSTPFVRPLNRHFRRPNGKLRAAETTEASCKRLVHKVWGAEPSHVELIDENTPWVKLHETAEMRREKKRSGDRSPHTGPGYRLRVTFDEPFRGPMIIGDSAHFGMGLFRAV